MTILAIAAIPVLAYCACVAVVMPVVFVFCLGVLWNNPTP